ncbi:conserved hypothetical protein [delta proteobacterium NaphS2]|nr:conserved hypothetical protein [delta proteobacterium NaphS2]
MLKRTVRADGNAVSTSETNGLGSGYELWIALLTIHFYDGHGAFGGTDAVFLAFFTINF